MICNCSVVKSPTPNYISVTTPTITETSTHTCSICGDSQGYIWISKSDTSVAESIQKLNRHERRKADALARRSPRNIRIKRH